MKRYRRSTNAFSIGSGTQVVSIPKEVADEIGMDLNKKTHFDVYTNYNKNEKIIMYVFTRHVEKSGGKDVTSQSK